MQYDFSLVLGDTLKNNYQYSDVWLITANLEAIKSIGLKADKKIKFIIIIVLMSSSH